MATDLRRRPVNESPARITPDLLARVREGDDDASQALVRILYPAIRANVRNHLRRQADHDDVSQEIFMKIFLKLDQYSGPQPFEHWVSRIAVTTCYDWLRRHRARPLVSFADLNEAEVEIIGKSLHGEDADDLEAQRELFHGLLDKLIASLKPREQIVIRLLDLEERSVAEIAELTGWSASKVKVTAMRARRRLADRLQRLERPPEH
jgi:RNA polymerase sigma-70 factor (ECF subfamily)